MSDKIINVPAESYSSQALTVRDAVQALDAIGRKAAIDDLLNKVALVQEVMERVMHDGEHYGKIPGCGDKPALLKAGAEKLGMTFRLKAQFDVTERDLGRAHREYSVKCCLSDGNMGVGSCSTMESKYRYRSSERKCPKCGKAAIIAGKAEFGGGWLCWAKKDGCGEKFKKDDSAITSQPTDKVEHDNPADYYNTCLKMGKKRAHVDAIITATACSDIFTQDVEEMVQSTESTPTTPAPVTAPTPAAPKAPAPKTQAQPNTIAPGNYPIVTVLTVKEVHSKPDAARQWTAYFIKFSDGFGELEAATFDKKIADLANELANTNENASLQTKPGRKPGTTEIVSLERANQPPPPKAPVEDDVSFNFDEAGQPIQETIP